MWAVNILSIYNEFNKLTKNFVLYKENNGATGTWHDVFLAKTQSGKECKEIYFFKHFSVFLCIFFVTLVLKLLMPIFSQKEQGKDIIHFIPISKL